MQLPGHCELKLTSECLRVALEDMVNATRKDGEDYIHVLSVDTHYGTGGATVVLTTDPQPVAEPASISVLEAA